MKIFFDRTRDLRESAPNSTNAKIPGTSSPGKIYILPKSWTPSSGPIKPPPPPGGPFTPEDLAAKKLGISVLGDPNLAKLHFKYRGYTVNWDLVIRVGNNLYLRFHSGLTDTRRALIVHEAVHAALDMKNAGELYVSESEAAAYLAQAVYALEIFPEGDVLLDSNGDPTMQAVFDRASEIAVALKAKKKLSELSMEVYALEAAVSNSSKYTTTAGNKSGYNGVK
ncbi:MAG TPA: hypothetical protein VE621_07000 [Bryobacteraceae bacterium]|nr:hypothetical protein [Bryobacteraceae bacterium]